MWKEIALSKGTSELCHRTTVTRVYSLSVLNIMPIVKTTEINHQGIWKWFRTVLYSECGNWNPNNLTDSSEVTQCTDPPSPTIYISAPCLTLGASKNEGSMYQHLHFTSSKDSRLQSLVVNLYSNHWCIFSILLRTVPNKYLTVF